VPNIDELLAGARAEISPRIAPDELEERQAAGALVVDIRPIDQRERDGDLAGALVIDRNVLEWRLDPTSPHHVEEVTDHEREIVLVCNEGYSSALAAQTLRRLGLHRATDLDGGFQAWLASEARGDRRGS
jgi:rhodanese-related sulfurtransferase